MVGDDKVKKGFSGLSDLVSDIDNIEVSVKPEPQQEAPTANAEQKTLNSSPATLSEQPPQPQQKTVTSKAEQTATSSSSPMRFEKLGKSNDASGAKWVLGCLVVVVLGGVLLVLNGPQNVKNSSSSSSITSSNYSSVTKNSEPTTQTTASSSNYSSVTKNSEPITQTTASSTDIGLQYTKPSVGANSVLSLPETRWCLREYIRFEVMKIFASTDSEIDKFNRIVDSYNSHCGSDRYRQGALERARREVEPYRSQIAVEAIREMKQVALPSPQKSTSSPSNNSLQYAKPIVGTNNLLSSAEIRWCLRENISLEALRNVANSDAVIVQFNLKVADYNSRCGSYRYRQGALEQAKREVELYRSQIVTETIRKVRQLDNSSQSFSPSVAPNSAQDTTPSKPSIQYTREAQQLLANLGYDPGPVDGEYGLRTADAVKTFQRETGITQDGWIDEDLLNALRTTKKPSIRYTLEAQQLLTDLGYAPGSIDGIYGNQTAEAVKSFQKNFGFTPDGWIDKDLLDTLRRVKDAF